MTPNLAPFLGKAGRLDFMISTTCPYDCIFCNYTRKMERFGKEPYAFDEAVKILEDGRRAGMRYVNFTGGEPTALPYFPKIARRAREMGYRVCLGTNFSRFADDRYYERVIPHLDEIVVSVHAADSETDRAVTGSVINFVRLGKALARVDREGNGVSLMTNTVLTVRTLGKIGEIVDWISGFGRVQHVILSNLSPEGNALRNYESIQPRLGDIAAVLPRLRAKIERSGKRARFFGFPMCVLGSVAACSDDLYLTPRIAVERCHKGVGVTSQIIPVSDGTRFKTKPLRCRGCIYENGIVCTGVFKKYIRVHGDGELHPVR